MLTQREGKNGPPPPLCTGMTFSKPLSNKQIARGGVPSLHSATTLGDTHPPKCSSTIHFGPWGATRPECIFFNLKQKSPTMPAGAFCFKQTRSKWYKNYTIFVQLKRNPTIPSGAFLFKQKRSNIKGHKIHLKKVLPCRQGLFLFKQKRSTS